MNINEFNKEYLNLSDERKKEGLHKLVDLLVEYEYDDTIANLIFESIEIEEQDGFGTEGADI